jgi:hypothetical protein
VAQAPRRSIPPTSLEAVEGEGVIVAYPGKRPDWEDVVELGVV